MGPWVVVALFFLPDKTPRYNCRDGQLGWNISENVSVRLATVEMEAVGLWGLGVYCSLVTTSFVTQAVTCAGTGLFAVFDAVYLRQRRSIALALLAFSLPLLIPTAEPETASTDLTFTSGSIYLLGCTVLSGVLIRLFHSAFNGGGEAVARPARASAQRSYLADAASPHAPCRKGSRDIGSPSLAPPGQSADSTGTDTAKAAQQASPRKESRLLSEATVKKSSAASRELLTRRRRPITASQRVAAELYAAEEAEKKKFAAAAAARSAATEAEQKRKQQAKDTALAQRKSMLASIQACSREVQDARVELTAAMDANRAASQSRARAADQARLAPTENNIKELDRCVAVASSASMSEQSALDTMKAAQERLGDLQKQLSMMPSVPYAFDD